MILGALGAVVAIGLGAGVAGALGIALVGFLIGFALFARTGQRTVLTRQARAESRFPTPDGPAR
jgi:UPF0716 family protein affecting phage T7 exclusion